MPSEAAAAAANALSAIGTAIAIVLFSSQAGLMRQMVRDGDAAQYSKSPTYVLLGNCLQWAAYAIAVQKRWDLFAVNIIGVAFCTAYCAMFAMYSKGDARRRVIAVCGGEYAVVASMYIVLFAILDDVMLPSRGNIAAVCAVAVNTLMFASPVKTVRNALRDKDASRVPACMTLTSLFAGINWGIFGLLIEDYFVVAPNAIGSVLSAAQLVALAYLRMTARDAKKLSPKAADTTGGINAAGAHVEHDTHGILMTELPSVNLESIHADACSEPSTVGSSAAHLPNSDSALSFVSMDQVDAAQQRQQTSQLVMSANSSKPALAGARSPSLAAASRTPSAPRSTSASVIDHVGVEMDDLHADLAGFQEDIIKHTNSIRSQRSQRGDLRVRAASSAALSAGGTPVAR